MVSRFLERCLAPALIDALKPEGLLLYQTFTHVTVGAVWAPPIPPLAWLLKNS